jgi:hypothetical protein
MKVVWYLLTVLLGAIGALGLLRATERLASGGVEGPGGLPAAQLGIGLAFLLLAWRSLRKAKRGAQ